MILFDFNHIYAGMNKGYFYAPIEELSEHFDVKKNKSRYTLYAKCLGKEHTLNFNDIRGAYIYILEAPKHTLFLYISEYKDIILDIDKWLRDKLIIHESEITDKEENKARIMLESVINNIENEISKR